jgi:hypothetical protein
VNINSIRTYVIWIVGGLFVWALWSQVFYQRPAATPRTFHEGEDIDINITLISPDAKNLACATPEDIKGYHCEFQSHTDRWTKPSATGRPPMLETLAPYKTTDDYLFLVPGLFAQDALRERLLIDPPGSNAEHIRFVANCRMHVEGTFKQVDVRWATTGPWQPQRDVWVGSVSGCWLSDG